jgi:hypothetical protein
MPVLSPDSKLRTAIYSAFGSITFNGSAVKTYSGLPENPLYPYILIANQTTGEQPNKDPYFWETDVLIEVVTGFRGGSGSYAPADEIADDVTEAMYNLTAADTFIVEEVRLDFSDYLVGETDTAKIVRKLLRFNIRLH